MNSNIVALGYKDDNGRVTVTDVLCMNWPDMTTKQKADLSWKLSQWAASNAPVRSQLPWSEDDPPLARCSKCYRVAWEPNCIGQRCNMTQPDGTKCSGVFVPPDAVNTER